MSQQLISRSPDLKKLRDEGYNIEVNSGYLILRDVPYVNVEKKARLGTLVSTLMLSNDMTMKPDTHTVHFEGEYPCHADGTAIAKIHSGTGRQELATGLVVDHIFSAKPMNGNYEDYYAKMTTYVAILSGPAQVIKPGITAKTFPVIKTKEDESVFNYVDTASSRAEIGMVTKKLELGKVIIVGLGGTGAYVLDFVAKTPVKEIHLFDGDEFLQHNAFRAPGAPSGEELDKRSNKALYFRELYSKMHRGIVAHPAYLDASNIDQLQGADFVFLCLDKGSAKNLIIEKLETLNISFIDVGMGIYLTDDSSLAGILRVTTSIPSKREHVRANKRIPFSDGDGNNEYDRNIQIADLNALNAALAVIKWKKLYGFYADIDQEYHSTYTIDGNILINEDKS